MRRLIPASLVAVLLGGTAAAGTTFVPMSDGDLVDRAEIIAAARVVEKRVVDGPATDYLVAVESLLAGYLPGSRVVVHVPGGELPDGRGLRVWGAPSWERGSEVLLFLRPHADGRYRLEQFLLGAFEKRRREGSDLAVRDLRQALVAGGGPAGLEARDWPAFVSWIVDRRRGSRREGSYFRTLGEPGLGSQFTLQGSDRHLRWFEFDAGQSVPFHAHHDGQPGVPGGGFGSFREALDAWNDDPGSLIDYRYAGPTSASGGLFVIDGRNTILFGDPNDDIGGSYDCQAGGVLSVGGAWYGASSAEYRGEDYLVITGADIVTNDHLGCFFAASSAPATTAAELFAHELGHTLGLGHACGDPASPVCQGELDDALMRAWLHDDGRGAALSDDDRAGIAALYGADDTEPPICVPPTAPESLWAHPRDATSIFLSWEDHADDETAYRIEVTSPGGLERRVETEADATAALLEELEPGQEYRIRLAALRHRDCTSSFVEEVTWTPADDVRVPRPPDALQTIPGELGANGLTDAYVTFHDRSDNELYFEIERRAVDVPAALFEAVAVLWVDGGTQTPGAMIGGHSPGSSYDYRVRAVGVAGASAYADLHRFALPAQGEPCSVRLDRGCALSDRFRIDVQWRNQHDGQRPGRPVASAPLGDRTTTFSFFRPDATDLVVKVLDGTLVNDSFWVFYGALSDVEYWITVTDTQTGRAALYHNPPGEICGRGDTHGIWIPGSARTPPAPLPSLQLEPPPGLGTEATTCQPDEEALCLLGGRFRVRVHWEDRVGSRGEGPGRPVADTAETGYFWFFRPDNTELAVKLLDGSDLNGHHWFFYGALSDVRYQITVEDLATGGVRVYENDQGNLCGQGDTQAF